MSSEPTTTSEPTNEHAQLPLPPGNQGLPLLGETLAFARAPASFFEKRTEQFGHVFTTHLFGAPTVCMSDADALRWVFAGENKYLQNQWSYGVRQLLGPRSLAMINGAQHRERRRLLLPHFGQEAMRAFVPAIHAIATRHLAQWAAQPGTLTVVPAMRAMVFEIAVALILGDDKVDQQRLSRLFQTWTAGLFTPISLDVPFTTFGRAKRSGREMVAYLREIVVERQRRAEQPPDILGSLIATRDADGQPLPNDVIVDDIQLLLFAGHDTTVTALSNFVMLLAQHPAVMQRAQAEVQQADLSEATLFDTLRKLPYLHNLINEGLRFIAPIGGAFRVTTEETTFGGYRIPQGWTIFWNTRAHANPAYWEQPNTFDPDRWSAERDEPKQAGAYIPFGGGPRVCLGTNFALVEMSVVLALLLERYSWSLLPDQDLTALTPFPTPKSGLNVQFRRA